MIQLTISEINVLLDALAKAASRHESEAAVLKVGSHFAGAHDRKAVSMRELHAKLLRLKADNRPMKLKVV